MATQQEVETLLTAVDQTTRAVEFADTVVMEFDETPVNGTRYRYIGTDAPDPRRT